MLICNTNLQKDFRFVHYSFHLFDVLRCVAKDYTIIHNVASSRFYSLILLRGSCLENSYDIFCHADERKHLLEYS